MKPNKIRVYALAHARTSTLHLPRYGYYSESLQLSETQRFYCWEGELHCPDRDCIGNTRNTLLDLKELAKDFASNMKLQQASDPDATGVPRYNIDYYVPEDRQHSSGLLRRKVPLTVYEIIAFNRTLEQALKDPEKD